MVNKKFSTVWGLVVFMAFFVPLYSFAAWAPPVSEPPNDTTETPFNTSTDTQIKNGDFSVNIIAVFMNAYFAQKLGIGTASIFATLDVNPTVTATSDLKNIQSGLIYNGLSAMTNYYGSYISAPTGSGTITNKYALVTELAAGKVGIGTVTPTAMLSVAGGVQIGDDTGSCVAGKAGGMRWHASTLEICNGTAWVSTAAPATCVAGQYCGMYMYYTVTGTATTYARSYANGDRRIKNGYGCISTTGPITESSGCDGVFRTTSDTISVYSYNASNPPTYFGAPVASYLGATVAQPTVSCPVGATYKEIGVTEVNVTGSDFTLPTYPSGTGVWFSNSADDITNPLLKTLHFGTCLKQ